MVLYVPKQREMVPVQGVKRKVYESEGEAQAGGQADEGVVTCEYKRKTKDQK